ncbi:MAG: Permeases of the drug/metabolite transporter (DMT) superfamily [Rhodobacteraceae bacterium HLUCCA08]|nr:MAG: Permeases of the drug/metabolite transporter (DMT) superfamily [Rhodobacteraceae bacterium HLUCCA08]
MSLSPNLRAALLMMASMSAFTVNDACMKLIGTNLPFFQGVFLRGILITFALVGLAAVMGQLHLPVAPRDRALIAARTLAEMAATIFFLTALYNMELANLSAILQALPLTVTLAAMLVLGEPVGWRRMAAIGTGFIGVLLIIQPGTDGFNTWSLMGVGAVLTVTVRDLTARRLSPRVPTLQVALAAAVGVTGMGAVGSLVQGWLPPAPRDLALLAGAALALMIGYIAAVSAMRSGDIAFVAPFRYTSLVVALVLGLVVFGDWPDPLTLAGAAIVVATGLFTIYREQRSRRAERIAQAARGLRIR